MSNRLGEESADTKAIAAGCTVSFASALLTCVMLFLNGSFVMAVLTSFGGFGPTWMSRPEVSQFLLFLLPVILVVIQWMLIDFVRSKFRQRTSK